VPKIKKVNRNTDKVYFEPGEPEYLFANSDLTGLMAQAELEAMNRAGKTDKKVINKQASWRFAPASPGQVQYMKTLKIPVPDDCNKGQASQLLEHYKSGRVVQEFIAHDFLPEPVIKADLTFA